MSLDRQEREAQERVIVTPDAKALIAGEKKILRLGTDNRGGLTIDLLDERQEPGDV